MEDNSARRNKGDGLLLNFFPATFSNDTLNTFVGPFKDDEAYAQLVAYQNGWTAWRDIDNGSRVYVWRHDDRYSFNWQSFKPATVRLDESPLLFCKVMLDGMDRHLKRLRFVKAGGMDMSTGMLAICSQSWM